MTEYERGYRDAVKDICGPKNASAWNLFRLYETSYRLCFHHKNYKVPLGVRKNFCLKIKMFENRLKYAIEKSKYPKTINLIPPPTFNKFKKDPESLDHKYLPFYEPSHTS